MFFRRGSAGPLVRGDSPRERLLRGLGLVAVFFIVAVAFWHNSQRQMRAIEAGSALNDPDGLLPEAERSFVSGFADSLKSRYGLLVRVELGPGAADFTETDSKTLYLGLDPAARKAATAFPPLVRQALGREFAAYLEQEHFQPYWPSGDWPQGLRTALTLIWNRLDNLDRPGAKTPGPAATDAPPAGAQGTNP